MTAALLAGRIRTGDLLRERSGRHDVLYEDTLSTWTQRHRAWLRAQDLGGGAQATLLDYLGAIDTLELRRGALEKTIAELVPASPCAQTVARLRCIDTLSALGLCAEIGDFGRFQRPGTRPSHSRPPRQVAAIAHDNSCVDNRFQNASIGPLDADRLNRPADQIPRHQRLFRPYRQPDSNRRSPA
jgi:hypothetical protein